MRRAVDDEVPGAVEEEAGPAAVRRVPPGLLDALPVHALGALGIVVVVRDVGPRQVVCDDLGLALISRIFWRNFGPFSRKFFFAFSAKFSPFFLGLTKF